MAKRARLDDETILHLIDSDDELDDNSLDSNDSTSGESDSEVASENEEEGEDISLPTTSDPATSHWHSQGNPRAPFTFVSDSKINIDVSDSNKASPLFYFSQFIEEDLIKLICEQTNKYAEQFFEVHTVLKPRSRARDWTPTTTREIKLFLSLLIFQGIIKKPTYELYFSRRDSISTPFFNKVMCEKRFSLLLKFCHFVDNKTYDANMSGKLFKISPVLNPIRKKCQELYTPQENICVDELLVLWKGRLQWKQFIPSKRSRFGFKLFVLCESGSGYIWNFIVYTGKDTDFGNLYPNTPVSSRVVLELSHELLNKGYTLYLDNWYSSVQLAETLCSMDTDMVGTMRINRLGVPDVLKNKRLKKGEHIARYKDKIMVLRWKDKREVTMISTIHDETFIDVEKRNKVERKPKLAVDYNKNMGGVDKSDGQMEAYPIARERVKKYYFKLFMHLLDIVCFNAFQLYKKNGGNKDRLHFMIELGEQIVQENLEEAANGMRSPQVGRPSLKPPPTRFTERHFPDFIPSSDQKKCVTRRCKVCYDKGVRKESRYWCPDCKVGLCVAPCFKAYHCK